MGVILMAIQIFISCKYKLEVKTMKRVYQIICAIVLICLSSSINAQLISLKTVPLATGEQFLTFPSQNDYEVTKLQHYNSPSVV